MLESQTELTSRIAELKRERNAVILAHLYQRPKVQDTADFTGDSLGLSKQAVETESDVIVFCGVRFMAETASILNPDRTVLLPDRYAGCELADMATVGRLKQQMAELPQDTAVVSYVNSSAEIKAESDVCCTSSNAVQVVRSLPEDRVLLLPDQNLASFVAEQVDKDIIPWEGYCYVHHADISPAVVQQAVEAHPGALVMCHPECTPEVRRMADYVGSTAQMLDFARRSGPGEFIVGTEDGLAHRLRKENPDSEFYPVGTTCASMRRITLEKIEEALEGMEFEVEVSQDVREKAGEALDRMLEFS